jgi:raffinose/stachyose/melibiose transport system substrate-binding protein
MLQFQEFLEPMGPHYTAEERAVLTGWEAVNATFDPESPDIYGVPAGSDGVTVVFYNGPLLANAGVDPTTAWPTNIDEFQAMLKIVQDSGVTPLTLDTYSLVWQVLFYWIGQTVGGAPGIGQLASGERNFSDPEIVNIITRWQEVAQYVVPGAETMEGTEAQQFFLAGETAMITGGFYNIDTMREFLGDDLGMIPIPDFSADAPITGGGIGGPGVAFIVSNYSQVKDAAISFVKFLESEEELLNRANSGEGHLVNLANINATEIYDDPFKVQQQDWAVLPSTIFWPDNVLPAELTTEIKAQSELAWVGSIDAAEFAAAVDAKRDDLLNG